MPTPRQATIYRVKKTQRGATGEAIILTRGNTHREPDQKLQKSKIDIQSGRFWVTKLPEWFLDKNYEAFLEVTARTKINAGKSEVEMSYPYKLEMKVQDKSFSKIIQDKEMLSGVTVGSTGFELRLALTEIDKVDQKKFKLIQTFIEETKLGDLANTIAPATGLPIPPKEIISTLFKTVSLLDELNEDDVVWEQEPKMDLRSASNSPLYEGWYAMVMTPKAGATQLPIDLWIAGGELFTDYESSNKNTPFQTQTYLTWNVIKQ